MLVYVKGKYADHWLLCYFQDGRLRLGDRILAVNGTSLVGADYQRYVFRPKTAIHHIRIAHDTPCLFPPPPPPPPKFCISIVFDFYWEDTVIPRRNWKQRLCKRLCGKQGVLWVV